MSFTKINKEDYVNKGVTGLPDQPALPTLEMQKKFDELSTDVIIPKFNELSAELDEEVKNLKEGAEGDLLAAVTGGTKITDITQITSGGMYYSTGDCPNAPMTDGSYFNYFASKNGWLVNIIAVNCGNTAEVFASTNKTEDGSTWVNQGWTGIAKLDDIGALYNKYYSSGNLNEFKTGGIYLINTYEGSAWSNIPNLEYYGGGLNALIVLQHGDSQVYTQTFVGFDGNVYHRKFENEWNEWKSTESERVKDGIQITDVTQITKGGMYYSNGNVSNAPTSDGVYYQYLALPQGYIVGLIARSGSDDATYFSVNSTSDGSTWKNSGWTRVAMKNDLSSYLPKSERYEALRALSGDGVTSYPSRVGTFRITSPVDGLPSGSLGFGTLMIYGEGYFTHIYRDASKAVYFGNSSDSIVAPTDWIRMLSADDFTVSGTTLTLNWL